MINNLRSWIPTVLPDIMGKKAILIGSCGFYQATSKHGDKTICWGFHKWGYPNSWMVYKGKSHLEMDEMGVPQFMEIPMYCNHKYRYNTQWDTLSPFTPWFMVVIDELHATGKDPKNGRAPHLVPTSLPLGQTWLGGKKTSLVGTFPAIDLHL